MRYREYRYPCSMPATAHIGEGAHRVMIVNVSPNGMRIANSENHPIVSALAPGQRLRLQSLDLMIDAEIRWHRDGLFGLRLARTLSPKALARIRQLRTPPHGAGMARRQRGHHSSAQGTGQAWQGRAW